MAAKHPYITGMGHLTQTISHFRNSFPANVDAATLKKLGIAANNESYVLNVLRFLEFIDQEGKKTELASKVFTLHDDKEFSQEFEKVVKKKYQALYELHMEAMWALDRNALVTFFRSSDKTTASVGKRQAQTFELLAAYSGHGDLPESKESITAKTKKPKTKKTKAKNLDPAVSTTNASNNMREFGLTVRIEINLPADGDQETYDRIFRSIKENLLDA